MKKLYILLSIMICVIGASAQLTKPFSFEADTDAASWTLFANGAGMSADDIKVVPNPFISDVNKSANVLEFTVFPDADPWVGMWTMALDEPMMFTEDAHTITMLVYKTVISPMIMKLEESADGGAIQEAKIENTLVDEWELITFDLSAANGFSYTKLVVFPDFPAARTEGTVAYLDNITSPGAEEPVSAKRISKPNLKIFPNPIANQLFIQFPEMTGFTITNLSGQSVLMSKFNSTNSKQVDIDGLKSGVYFINVSSASGSYSSKLVKR